MKRFFIIEISGLWLLTSGFAYAILDTNNNGLSDFWERQFNNGSLFDASFDPQGDDDGDGWTNAQEAEAGTNPFDPNPPDGIIRPVMASVPPVWSEPDEYDEIYLISPEAVTVTWPTIAGKQYTLFFSPDLTQGSWLPVGDPFIAYGGEVTYGFETGHAERCFWRVTATDVDSDNDGLTDYEEILAGTNPYLADSDGDTLSDWEEFMAGTDPLNQDTDGDGIPDSLDSEPLVSAHAFADADGDGIPDGDDANPNDPRGSAPTIAAENASGSPLSNLIKDETVKFVLTVSNPAGPAPTATDLTFFLNGTEEAATITALGSPVASSQRFVLTWVAKTTANYPILTLQNLTLRFRDSEQATSWINLARIDVAEWEGKVITLPFVTAEDSWGYQVMTHLSGMKKNQAFVSKNSGADLLYRGPKNMTVKNAVGATFQIPIGNETIPFFKIEGSPAGSPSVKEQLDYAAIATGMDVDYVFNNGSSKSLKFELNQAGIDVTLDPNQTASEKVSLTGATFPFTTFSLIKYHNGNDWTPFSSSTWIVANAANANGRTLRSINVLTTDTGQLKLHGVTNFMTRDVKITPHARGTLEHPGLPQESVTSLYSKKYMPISTGEWRKVVLKIYPQQEHFSYSRGYRLNLGTGATGNDSPQQGWTAQTEDSGTFTPLTIPADGKIEILPVNTELHTQLTSHEGLTLFLKRDETVDQVHELSLDILPKVTANATVRMGRLVLLPVDLLTDLNNDGQITTADNPFSDAALASVASDGIKDTEYMFQNDNISNGQWDKDDTDPAKPSTENHDDDVEEITIKAGITEGEVWLEHPAIAGLTFYKSRECKESDVVRISNGFRFNVSESNPLPEKLFMRADSIIYPIDYPESNPQVEGELALKIFTSGIKIDAAKINLTVVGRYGARNFFNAARDYIFENNTKLYVCQITYPKVSTRWRLCVMAEELTTLEPIETYHGPSPLSGIPVKPVGPFGFGMVVNNNELTALINGPQVFFDPLLVGFLDPSKQKFAAIIQAFTSDEKLMTNKSHGRFVIRNKSGVPLGLPVFSELSLTSSDETGGLQGSLLAGTEAEYVSQSDDGQWDFGTGRLPLLPAAGVGGLSDNHNNPDRAGMSSAIIGHAKIPREGYGCVFVAAHEPDFLMAGVNLSEFIKNSITSKVEINTTTKKPKIYLTDGGDASVAMAHMFPDGNLKTIIFGKNIDWHRLLINAMNLNTTNPPVNYHLGVPYYTNVFTGFKSNTPRN